MGRMKKILAFIFGLMVSGVSTAALAGEPVYGQPVDKQLMWQKAATPIARQAEGFHDNMLLPIIIAITLFVMGLLFYTMWRFRASANPNPSKTTHNVLVEVVWTVVPVLILVVMAVPSMKLLYAQAKLPEKAAVVIKATGHQWYWSYEYADQNIGFDANMLKDGELKAGQPRLLATDNPIVVPVNKVVKLLITSEDVMHAWTIPSFFIKSDAVPGRINENWFKAEKTGVYYGQCSELCGINHGYMPIEVHVVSDADYAKWLADAKTKYALNDNGTPGAGQMAALSTATTSKN
jgi:cytochrome c oxidase subunit II